MAPRPTFRTAVSAAVIATLLAGCASGTAQVSSFGGRTDSDLGVATRALAAIQAEQFEVAIPLAERAVEKTPRDAGFRTLLGNAYFGAGRFRSAEQAYRDGLSIYANQPQALLRLALVQIAQGKKRQALATLDAGRGVLDASNYGLALALAGETAQAVAVLDQAARSDGADSRVRQNLALAYAFAGDWQQARVVASQDVAADQLDSRLQQWASLANPAQPSDQVAALLGVTPAAADAGQPVRLALVKDPAPEVQMAEAAPVAAPTAAAPVAPPPAPEYVAVAMASPMPAPVEAPLPAYAAEASVPLPAALAPVVPVSVSAAMLAPQAAPVVADPLVAELTAPVPSAAAVAPAPPPPNPKRVAARPESPKPPMTFLAAAQKFLTGDDEAADAPKPAAKARVKAMVAEAKAPAKARPSMVKASLPAPAGKSSAVVQLGAYSSPDRVQVAWDKAARQYGSLKGYQPMSAAFSNGKDTVYRLSVKGFASREDASNLCASLKRSGRACFVRNSAGDRPIQLASR